MNHNFAVFILSNNRPNNVITLKTLRSHGYTGLAFIVIDNEDGTVAEYKKNFGVIIHITVQEVYLIIIHITELGVNLIIIHITVLEVYLIIIHITVQEVYISLCWR